MNDFLEKRREKQERSQSNGSQAAVHTSRQIPDEIGHASRVPSCRFPPGTWERIVMCGYFCVLGDGGTPLAFIPGLTTIGNLMLRYIARAGPRLMHRFSSGTMRLPFKY
jgi:hypothetical protein